MGRTRKILCVVGTRPEAIKMAPVVLALEKRTWADVRVLATAQHRDMLDQVLSLFDIRPHADLDVMRRDQTLAELSARLLSAIDEYLCSAEPDMVLAQGDTTTVLMTAMACFYKGIPFGHVEAGLRTNDLGYPFPEEMNRIVADRLSRLLFAPTLSAKENLLAEGIPSDAIHVTGNTVIDALIETAKKEIPLGVDITPKSRLILVTAHRRESFGAPFLEICGALSDIAERNPGVVIVYPVHPNPNVLNTVHKALGKTSGIVLTEPMEYGRFVSAMKRSYLILTDSGGVQEEAPALGKPVLVLRGETERPEAVKEGVVKVVGTSREAIVNATDELLHDEARYKAMAKGVSPYGDGHAAPRIADILERDMFCS